MLKKMDGEGMNSEEMAGEGMNSEEMAGGRMAGEGMNSEEMAGERMAGEGMKSKGVAGEEMSNEEMSIEETFAALDDLIDRLESGKGSLEDAFKNYEKGMKLVKSCNDKIEKIEKQIMVLSGEPVEDKEDVVYF